MDEQWLQQLPIAEINSVTPVGGGDVNQAFKLSTPDDTYFLLVQPHHDADFYDGEIAGLQEFETANILAPRVIANGEIQGDAYLLITYLSSGTGSQADLGRLVAKLHHHHNPNGSFGFDTDYKGTAIEFDNSWTTSWSELFVDRRLDKLRDEIVRQHLWSSTELAEFNHVRQIIINQLANHQSEPSLLHGDLWGGNYLFTDIGQPALIDPAAMYGDREFDLGVTTVFGGFDSEFYQAYGEAYPLSEGANQRMKFYRLYYLMVHLVKFGEMYASSVQSEMTQIVNQLG